VANFYAQGEVCTNSSHLYVQRCIYAVFVEKLQARVEKLRVGDPTDPRTISEVEQGSTTGKYNREVQQYDRKCLFFLAER
jgi:acyl-CoA reductase-like NAD-dependent aldehyde dehydrogenase